MPFTLNVFNSKKQNKTVVTLEIEVNQNCNLGFKRLERVTVALTMGSADIEIQKAAGAQVEQQGEQLLWHVINLHEEGSAVLQFASQQLQFDDLFPLEVSFDETYSLIDMNVVQVANASSGDAMSVKTLHSLSTDNYTVTA